MISKEEATARARSTFNAASDYFDAPPMSFWNYFGRQTIDRVSLNSGDRVLDVCCGSGASAIPAAQSVGKSGSVVGVDLADKLLDLARICTDNRLPGNRLTSQPHFRHFWKQRA